MDNLMEVLTERLEQQKGIDPALVRKALEVQKELARYGLDTNRGYNLAPALGGKVVGNPQRRSLVADNRTFSALIKKPAMP